MSSGWEYMTREGHEDAHFFAFVAHNKKAYGHDKGKWSLGGRSRYAFVLGSLQIWYG